MWADAERSPSTFSLVRDEVDRRAAWAVAALACLVVMIVTYVPPGALIPLVQLPDGLEYAAGAQRLATLGRYDLPIGSLTLPSRYPPSFACLLAPAYWIAPGDVFAGIWACRFIWAAGCGAMTWSLAHRIGAMAALLAVTAIAVHPIVLDTSSTILSDAPSVAALLVLLAIRLRGPMLGVRPFAVAGAALAVGVACRSLSIAFALPFVALLTPRLPRRIASTVALLAPPLAVLAANAIYNRARFGSFAMNGYIYWCALPYSRFDYAFHPSYLAAQVRSIVADPWLIASLVAGIIGSVILVRWARPLWRSLVMPAFFATVPLAVLHLFYFYRAERLFLPLIVACCLPAVIAFAAFAGRFAIGRAIAAIAIVGLTCWAASTHRASAAPLPVNALLSQLRDRLPTRCRLITTLDPLSFEAFVSRGTEREWIPASREQEYADKTIADHRLDLAGIPRPPPLDHRDPRLIAEGARLAIAETAADDALLDRLADPAGPPVFVDLATINLLPALRPRLAQRFVARPVVGAPAIVECVPRATRAAAVTR